MKGDKDEIRNRIKVIAVTVILTAGIAGSAVGGDGESEFMMKNPDTRLHREWSFLWWKIPFKGTIQVTGFMIKVPKKGEIQRERGRSHEREERDDDWELKRSPLCGVW